MTERRPALRLPARVRLDFWLDAALAVAFTLDYSIGFTGQAIHEWLGIGLGVALVVHLTLHWDWVLRTTRRLFGKRGVERVRWTVDVLLMLTMTLCVLSGVLISAVALPAVGMSISATPFWTNLHDTTAQLSIFLVAVHAAMSWKWIITVGRRLVRRSG